MPRVLYKLYRILIYLFFFEVWPIFCNWNSSNQRMSWKRNWRRWRRNCIISCKQSKHFSFVSHDTCPSRNAYEKQSWRKSEDTELIYLSNYWPLQGTEVRLTFFYQYFWFNIVSWKSFKFISDRFIYKKNGLFYSVKWKNI